MAALRAGDTLADIAIEYWARVFQLDWMKHRKQRHRPAIAADAGISVKSLERYIYEVKLPPGIDTAYAIGRAVGMADVEVEGFYRRRADMATRTPTGWYPQTPSDLFFSSLEDAHQSANRANPALLPTG